MKYDYESGFARAGKRLGWYRKPLNLNNSFRNVVSLSNITRDFSSEKSHVFKKLMKHNGKYANIIEVLADVNFLQDVYQKIKPNQEVITKSSDFETLADNWFHITSKRLLNGSFQFRSARRAIISNPIKPRKRFLLISNFRDNILQQAMKMVLEIIYDKKFLDTSHGFRPSKGCHSALKMIRLFWAGISWFLEFDVEKFNGNMNRHRLISILKEDLKDQRFLDLVHKLLNGGIVGRKERLGSESSIEVSQVPVLLPIFSNIYLHKLDEEVAKITKEYQKGIKKCVFKKVFDTERWVHLNKKFERLTLEQQSAIMSKNKTEYIKMGARVTN